MNSEISSLSIIRGQVPTRDNFGTDKLGSSFSFFNISSFKRFTLHPQRGKLGFTLRVGGVREGGGI
jgi:hypothetical protein